MLQLDNTTPFPATLALLPDAGGVLGVLAVVKATYVLDPEPFPDDEPVPIVPSDQYLGEPGRSSLVSASDISLPKPGTDVLLLGDAVAPSGRALSQLDVELRVGPVQKTVRVYGDRVWTDRVPQAPTPPRPFETMPLVWERAFGGSEQGPPLSADERNPVGVGHRPSARRHEGLPLPNLEDPRSPVRSPSDRPQPAGFGPLPPAWLPRRSYAGTYDEAWRRERAPYLPRDFDARFLQTAPADQVVPGHLAGGERVSVTGAASSGPLAFSLPAARVRVLYRLDRGEEARDAALDTVVVEPEVRRLVMVWSAFLRCDKRALRVREVSLSLEGR